jgi:nicotinamidase-related amidase
MSTSPIALSSTALVFIDLQCGIVKMPILPRSGEEVVQHAARLAARFREAQAGAFTGRSIGGPHRSWSPLTCDLRSSLSTDFRNPGA